MPQTTRSREDVAAAYERGLSEGIDLVIELVRRQHLTPEQRHAVEQDIATFLAHPAAETRRELLARRDDLDDE